MTTPMNTDVSVRETYVYPDGLRIAFMRDNNLFIYDIRFKTERQITFDGKYNHIINGAPDWVYEEEFAFNRAFEWAPDGSAIAFIRFDESQVKEFPMNMFEGQASAIKENEVYPSVYSYKYPKAGEANSTVSVHVYDIQDKTTLKMDIGEETDLYIPVSVGPKIRKSWRLSGSTGCKIRWKCCWPTPVPAFPMSYTGKKINTI